MHIDKKSFVVAVFFVCFLGIFAQDSVAQKTLRIKVWSPTEQNPGIFQSQASNTELEIAPYYIKQISPFLLSGMIYGWTFEYTPSDKTRGVAEFFELKPINQIAESDKNISFSDVAVLDSRLYCWVQYERTDEMMHYKKVFESVNAEKIHGVGYSNELDFSKGVQKALTDSAKDAIHSYAKKLVKNKPKSIAGKILLKQQDPSIKIVNGKVSCDLDFFLYVDKIIQYSK